MNRVSLMPAVLWVLILLCFHSSVYSGGVEADRVIAIIHASGCYVIGGTVNGKWTDDEKIWSLMRGGEDYKLYSLTKYLGKAKGTKPVLEVPGDFPYLEVKPKASGGKDIIGINGTWNALPRIPRVHNPDQKTYRDIVREHLQGEGIDKPVVQINQIIRVDLDGDKQDEVLVTATTPNPDYAKLPGMKKGDYSVVLLRRIVNGKVRTTVLAGEYYPTRKIYTTPTAYHVAAVLDLNGDGTQEILVGWRYYEGQGTVAFTVNGAKATEVMGGGFGA